MHHAVGSCLVRTPLPFQLSKTEHDKALVIVETRPSYFLPRVVASAVRTHPGWHLYVFGTPEVHALLDAACKNYASATRVTLDAVPTMTLTQYSHLLMSPRFWDVVREEHVLVFQADCVLVRTTPPEMYKYDMVGAVCGDRVPERFIINGGLSLRRRSKMIKAVSLIRDLHPGLLDQPEDVAFTTVMRKHPNHFSLPDMAACDAFAIETFGDPHRAIGLHGTDKYYAPSVLVAALLSRETAPART